MHYVCPQSEPGSTACVAGSAINAAHKSPAKTTGVLTTFSIPCECDSISLRCNNVLLFHRCNTGCLTTAVSHFTGHCVMIIPVKSICEHVSMTTPLAIGCCCYNYAVIMKRDAKGATCARRVVSCISCSHGVVSSCAFIVMLKDAKKW